MQAGDRAAAPLRVRTLSLPPPVVTAMAEAAVAPAPRRPAAPQPPAPSAIVAPQAEPVPLGEALTRAGGAELPVYATRLPDPAELHYRLQRGQALGAGRLQWQRDGERYALRLDGACPGQPS